MIVICVILIGMGGANSGPKAKTNTHYLVLALIFSMLTGLLFSINSVNVEYVIQKVGFPASQLNFDGNFLFGLILIPFFLYEMIWSPVAPLFTAEDILMVNVSIVCVTVAIVCFSFAM